MYEVVLEFQIFNKSIVLNWRCFFFTRSLAAKI